MRQFFFCYFAAQPQKNENHEQRVRLAIHSGTHHRPAFNAAALVDAAKGYESHLLEGGKMMITLAGAMSTAELGISLAK